MVGEKKIKKRKHVCFDRIRERKDRTRTTRRVNLGLVSTEREQKRTDWGVCGNVRGVCRRRGGGGVWFAAKEMK